MLLHSLLELFFSLDNLSLLIIIDQLTVKPFYIYLIRREKKNNKSLEF